MVDPLHDPETPTTIENAIQEQTTDSYPSDHDYYNELTMRRRPENLYIADTIRNIDSGELSPLSTASGPYIPICECFSGSPALTKPSNFTSGASEALNSFSRLDCSNTPLTIGHPNLITAEAKERSSDESESVFTDEDDDIPSDSQNTATNVGLKVRRLRPSDSSIENENIGWTATHRYSKFPMEENKCLNHNINPPPRPPKKGNACTAEEQCEAPQSQTNPFSPQKEFESISDTKPRTHVHSDTVPRAQERQVFRYDFDHEDKAFPPLINRSLKPKPHGAPSKSCELIEVQQPAQLISNTRQSLLLSRTSLQITPSRSDDTLQYLDLDHTNGTSPPLPQYLSSAFSIHSTSNVPAPSLDSRLVGVDSIGSERGIVYKTVDFVKTEAFNRTRQDAEMNRFNKDK